MTSKSILAMFVLMVIAYSSWGQETICHKYNTVNPTQEPSSGPRCRIIGDTFYLDGMVTEEMFYELRDYAPNIKHIELNSYGGLVEPAHKIAELIRSKKITTNVRKNAKCSSACTLIFQAGIKRTAHPAVRFLYHGVRLSNLWTEYWIDSRLIIGRQKSRYILAQQFEEVGLETEKLFAAYIELGMDPQFILNYKSLPEDPNWFANGNFTRTQNLIISSPKLINFNIVQDFDWRESVPEN